MPAEGIMASAKKVIPWRHYFEGAVCPFDVYQHVTDEATFPFFDCDVADGFVG